MAQIYKLSKIADECPHFPSERDEFGKSMKDTLMNLPVGHSHPISMPNNDFVFIRVTEYHMAVMTLHEYHGFD